MLRSIGAPVPRWQVFRDVQEIAAFQSRPSADGWTIRTCLYDGRREFDRFSMNYVAQEDLESVLRARLSEMGGKEFYIVYPSWEFLFSCNVLRLADELIIEGVYGSQKDLAIGRQGPEFGVRIPFGMRSQMLWYLGMPGPEVLGRLGRIMWWCARVPWDEMYTEVAVTKKEALVFYDLFRVSPRVLCPASPPKRTT